MPRAFDPQMNANAAPEAQAAKSGHLRHSNVRRGPSPQMRARQRADRAMLEPFSPIGLQPLVQSARPAPTVVWGRPIPCPALLDISTSSLVAHRFPTVWRALWAHIACRAQASQHSALLARTVRNTGSPTTSVTGCAPQDSIATWDRSSATQQRAPQELTMSSQAGVLQRAACHVQWDGSAASVRPCLNDATRLTGASRPETKAPGRRRSARAALALTCDRLG